MEIVSRINRRNIFLIDGIGAAASAFSLGVALPFFNRWVGLPASVLDLLAAIAVVLALYSFSRYYFADVNNRTWLSLLVLGNLAYCVLTASLVLANLGTVEPLGLVYFATETLVILLLVGVEFLLLNDRREV